MTKEALAIPVRFQLRPQWLSGLQELERCHALGTGHGLHWSSLDSLAQDFQSAF